MLNGYNLQAQGTEAHKFFASYHKFLSQLECYMLNRTQVRVTFLSGTTITVYVTGFEKRRLTRTQQQDTLFTIKR